MSKQAIVDSTMINVLNHSASRISLPTQINPDGYWFEASIDGVPSLIPMSFSEIRVANSQSQIFREGYLRFDEDVEESVYEALKIRDWQDVLSDDEIRDILLNPTKDKLERIVRVTSMSMFDRIRSILISLDNAGTYDIPKRVADIVNNRYQELYRGIRKSEITITKSQQEISNTLQSDVIADEIAKIKAELEKKIRAEIEAEMNANKVATVVDTKVTPKVENKPINTGKKK